MSTKSKSVKGKVITGYILLFIVGAVSIAFLYNQIVKTTRPKGEVSKSRQLIDLSDALSMLYTAESAGQNSEFIISEKGFSQYNRMIDSVISRMNRIKVQRDSVYDPKLDSIAIYLEKKKTSVARIRVLNHQYNNETSLSNAKRKLEKSIDSLNKSKTNTYVKNTRTTEFNNIISEVLTPEQINRLNKQLISDAELLALYNKTYSELTIREDKIRNELKEKERILQNENLILSGKIQLLLSDIGDEILENSYREMEQNQKEMEHTTLVLLWAAILGVLLLLLFGWIIIRDLSRQQHYRDRLEKLNQENSMLLRSKTMLLATVTHDLQTPLGSILGFSDLLKATPLDTVQKQYVSNISGSSDYILNLVNDLVDFSKLENNNIKIKKVAFNPKQLIETTFNTLKRNAIDKDIVLLYEVEDTLDINVVSDPYRVKQVLTNLVTNAIKFTQKGHVKIVGKIANDTVVLEVSDTGIGISEEEQQHIFEEFTQAHPDIEKQFGGTGLGLTISKRIAELLGGSLSVESQLDSGSIFSFSIPLVISEVVSKEEKKINNYDFLKGKKILIIDDDNMQLSLIATLFASYPIELTTLNDATKVIPLLMEKNFDLIFTDIQMPKKSGYALIKKIRNHPDNQIKNIPVVALSGKRDISLEDYIEKQFTYFLGKPLQMEEALQVMNFIFNQDAPRPEKNETVIEKIDSDKLYDLSSLKQFTANDKSALNNIISVFLKSSKTSINELESNTENSDKLAEIAHRMIPMLRQIESHEIVWLLEKLEDKKIPKKEIKKYISGLIEKLNILTTEIESNYES
ncbi:MAG: ATP-binding protein [Flavobacteriaceae bacterium]